MSRRDHPEARCEVCRMHRTLCICALVPRLQTRTRLVLLVHFREARKPSNTGQLAARCLARSTVNVYGKPDQVLEAPVVSDAEVPLLMFPDPDAPPISQYAASDKPIVLIVPDGNWNQARKAARRVSGSGPIPCVTLPAAGPTEYRLRAEPREGGLATLEAIARAIGFLEGNAGPEIERAMLAVFRVMVERTLWFRGKLRDHEVTGGIPEAALAHDPRGAMTKQSLRARDP
jgi:DTW domain-containing protein